MRRGRPPIGVGIAIAAALIFVGAIAFFAIRDHNAVNRCHVLGGQTWDSGEHCAIGVDRVVDTHNRTWS